MNPLEHFGIKSKFIRGDTSSYNDEKPVCSICGKSNILPSDQWLRMPIKKDGVTNYTYTHYYCRDNKKLGHGPPAAYK